jgi:PAS domain S-box-containing protein
MLDIAHDNTDIPIPFLDHGEEIGDMAKTLEIFARNTAIRRRMEIRMSKIIEATPNGIIMINREGHIEIMNQQAEKIFGYHREQLLGKSIEELIPTRMANTHPHSRHEYFNNPTPRAMGVGRELFGLRQDNSEFPLEIGLAPIETEEGTKVLASIVDISERKKAEQILKEHQQELERYNSRLSQTNKELETFAYVASHDLKSPLRGIAQLSSWIEEDLAEKDFSNIENHTSMLRNRIQRMEKLLDDLLIFYRAGKIDGNLAKVDIGHMAKELFEIQNNKPGLQLELGVNLPTLTTLSTPFEQVLRNLFSNAIKHHDHDQGKIQFSCRDIDRHFYEFSVCDDGPGIPQQFQERIFGMFQTLKPRDELEGSGMGLALIKKIVENYGGTIVVSSEGRGCCFRFTWPKNIKRNNNND